MQEKILSKYKSSIFVQNDYNIVARFHTPHGFIAFEASWVPADKRRWFLATLTPQLESLDAKAFSAGWFKAQDEARSLNDQGRET